MPERGASQVSSRAGSERLRPPLRDGPSATALFPRASARLVKETLPVICLTAEAAALVRLATLLRPGLPLGCGAPDS